MQRLNLSTDHNKRKARHMAHSTCHCGEPADLLVSVLETPDAAYSEATYAVCFDHLAIAMDAMEEKRAEINGVIKVRAERQSAYTLAWFLIDHCPWRLHSPEWGVILRIARLHEKGSHWVTPEMLQHTHGGGSKSNSRELLNRPRLVDPEHPLIESKELERVDGKRRTYYRLTGWEGP